jgi:hypothetical protein
MNSPEGRFLTRWEFNQFPESKIGKWVRAIRYEGVVYTGKRGDTHFYIRWREGILTADDVEEGYIIVKWIDISRVL